MSTTRQEDDMPAEIDFSGAERGKFYREGATLRFPTIAESVLQLIADQPGLTDREITDTLWGRKAPQQSVNQAARRLQAKGSLIRQKRPDGLLGNYLAGCTPASPSPARAAPATGPMPEPAVAAAKPQETENLQFLASGAQQRED